ncbi:putative serine/threonine protein kinase [Streptomyces lincolnensis]|uniref:Putative serine/threonine protein kinase n=1 Tax=Streptomyces lincolnensis TaxID=1915 RepID=A0A1B1M3V0_STRLN|nr:PQQ-binding-like beta-propeller repeat protein [Streptomyces lincolnensis]ANS63318.1 putative serine/threonine protein kinase [Streptomyces lincolnensis]AXG52240.1 putative serine/threonine protein kinase [Streptomyces lincolnensis]QMV05213.1 PQQ-binding-like beta-propeller repeat protein [Streptomyces lincolnensis]
MPLRDGDPASVGGYALLDRIGAGGMGTVFLGRSAAGRRVAVKLVHPQLCEDEEFRVRFRQEIAAVRRVSGAFTAPVVDADPDAEQPWMATMFVPGPSLAAQVDSDGPVTGPELRLLALGLIEALREIHRAGVVHRDLKPGNVLMAEDGPRVIDFGISRAADNQTLTVTGNVIGTPPFMSPEQLRSPRDVTSASDVFSLGSLLVYAATGNGPFDADTPYMAGYQVMYEEPALEEVPQPLRDIAARCLDKDPAARPGLTELHEWFRTLPEGETASTDDIPRIAPPARADTTAGRAIPGASTEPVTHGGRPGKRRGRRLTYALTAVGTAVAVTGLGLAAVNAFSGDTHNTVRTASLPTGWQPWQTTLRQSSVSDTMMDSGPPGCVSEGTVLYCGGEGFTVAKVDAATGRVLWRSGDSVQNSTPFGVRNGVVYVAEQTRGEFRTAAVHTGTGKRLWARETPNDDSVVFDGGLLTTTGDIGGFIAYDTSGKKLWQSRKAAFCDPLSLAGVPYAECTIAGEPGHVPVTLLRLDPADGTAHRLAALPIGSKGLGQSGGEPVYAQPAAAANQDGEIESERRYTTLLRVDPRTGAVRPVPLPRTLRGAPTLLGDDVVVFAQTNGTVTAVSATDGKQLWQRSTGMEGLSQPVLSTAYDRIYFSNRIGRVLAMELSTGRALWRTSAVDALGDASQDWAPSVTLVRDAVVAMAGNTLFSVGPDGPGAQSAD